MAADRPCPRGGTRDSELDIHGVYNPVSTGWGRANEEWTWYCTVWCCEAANGVPSMFRCLRQTTLFNFVGERERPDAATIASADGARRDRGEKMSRPALPEERGHDERPEPPTLSELKRAHEWRTEHRDRHEPGDGAFSVMVCKQCGHERPMERRGRPPDCPVREIPGDAIEYARQHGLISESVGACEDSMLGVPGPEGENRSKG